MAAHRDGRGTNVIWDLAGLRQVFPAGLFGSMLGVWTRMGVCVQSSRRHMSCRWRPSSGPPNTTKPTPMSQDWTISMVPTAP